MKLKTNAKILLLLVFVLGSVACWDDDDDDDWGIDRDYHSLVVRIEADCHNPPYEVYIDDKDSDNKVGEIRNQDGELRIVLEEGWYRIYVRDDRGDWIYDERIHLDEDETVRVDC